MWIIYTIIISFEVLKCRRLPLRGDVAQVGVDLVNKSMHSLWLCAYFYFSCDLYLVDLFLTSGIIAMAKDKNRIEKFNDKSFGPVKTIGVCSQIQSKPQNPNFIWGLDI